MELEKVKKRRVEREREKEERDREQEMMQRDKEADYFREWEKQEDSVRLPYILGREVIGCLLLRLYISWPNVDP